MFHFWGYSTSDISFLFSSFLFLPFSSSSFCIYPHLFTCLPPSFLSFFLLFFRSCVGGGIHGLMTAGKALYLPLSTSLTFLSYLILSYFSHGSNHKENIFVFFTSVEAITYVELLSASFNQKMLKCGIKFSRYRQLYNRNKLF